MSEGGKLTEGKIFAPLIRFAMPVLFALLLQAMYGAYVFAFYTIRRCGYFNKGVFPNREYLLNILTKLF